MMDNLNAWVPPQYSTRKRPGLRWTENLTHCSDYPQNFPRAAKWSPDGSTVLCHCENRTFERLDISQEGFAGDIGYSCNRQTFLQTSPILDFVWFPGATPVDPASFCFVASIRDCPVKLLDASDGRLRASYKIVDHRERQIAPHSIAFNPTANKIYCGFEDAIEIFDVHSPGEGVRLPTTPSKKSKDGLKGIISALAFSPSHALYAAGSLAPRTSNIALFSESESDQPLMFVGADVKAAVTQLHFNPMKPHMLYASFRKQDAIYSWDIRADVSAPLQILRRNSSKYAMGMSGDAAIDRPYTTQREMTNQKLRFDVDLGGHWLGVGDQNGVISIFDLNYGEGAETALQDEESSSAIEVMPSLRYEAHGDSIGSVTFHPLHPLLLSVSGSRHFIDENDVSSSSDSSESEDQGDPETDPEIHVQRIPNSLIAPLDGSIKLWNLDGSGG